MQSKIKVLFVDDEPAALEGFKLTQGKQYDLRTAVSGAQGLEILRREPDIAVIVSDMRMPEMDGAAFLAKAKDDFPDAVRLLLTGHADMEAAARAVNDGRIFRFLIKPCAPDDLRSALAAAVQMNGLVTAERVLLQKTLVASVKAVVSVLGLTNPEALGRAVRIKDRARLAAQKLPVESRWGVEFAAMFSQIAAAGLPEETVRKLYRGEKLSRQENGELGDAMAAITGILAEIPRLEPVTRILAELTELSRRPQKLEHAEARAANRDALLLHAVIDLDALESSGQSPRQAINQMRQQQSMYGAAAIDALAEVMRDAPQLDVASSRPADLKVGMVLAEDLRTTDGLLLLPRGFELTRSSCVHIVERFRHCLPDRVKVHLLPEGADKETGSVKAG